MVFFFFSDVYFSFILHATQYILHSDKHQKNEIHSLNVSHSLTLLHIVKEALQTGMKRIRGDRNRKAEWVVI